MGHRATFIPVNNLHDLTAVLLMQEGLEDVAGYACSPYIAGFCELNGQVYCCFGHDSSSAVIYYGGFSPSFSKFKWLDDLRHYGDVDDQGRLEGANYLKTPRAVEEYLEKKGK